MSLALVAPSIGSLADAALLARQRELIRARREIDAELVLIAGEIARRSTRALGFGGLAARLGARSPEQLIAQESGLTLGEARSLVRVGTLDADSPVALAVHAGAVSVASADAVVRGLGDTDEAIGAELLTGAAVRLLEASEGISPDELMQDARAARAELDAASVVDRERELRARRSLRIHRDPDGMARLVALLDPESAAFLTSVLDTVTSPRRGGPRFVASHEVERAKAIVGDARTTEQLALDAFIELVRLGAAVDPGSILGVRSPAVRVLVTEADLTRREGAARIEGESEAVSIATAERHICAAGTVPILFDSDGQVVNVGRESRLFTARQRIGLAARDGGCRWPGCDRPPSWCEAHHIDEWKAHGGRTDIADGILLCRFHHLLVHDRGWRIVRDRLGYQARPGTPGAEPMPLPSKSRIRPTFADEHPLREVRRA